MRNRPPTVVSLGSTMPIRNISTACLFRALEEETMRPTMLSVGLDPQFALTSASSRDLFPDLDHDKILDGAEASYGELRSLGFTIDRCLIDGGATAEATFRAALADTSYDYIDIGGGIRLDPARTQLFETLVNVSVELNPSATLVFDTGPATKADAVRRWFPLAGRP